MVSDSGAAGSGDGGINLSCIELKSLRDPQWDNTTSALAILFTAVTCDTKEPVADLDKSEGAFTFEEDNEKLSSEARPKPVSSRGKRVYISLVLDMSSSTKKVLDSLIEGAKQFVTELLVTRKTNAFIGIEVFDGAPTNLAWQLPIPDAERLHKKLDELKTTYKGRDENSTNLNGAVVGAIQNLQTRQTLVMDKNDNGVVTQGYMVLFTDGFDTSGLVTAAAARTAVANARASGIVGASVRAPVETYAVAYRGDDYKPEKLVELLSGAPSLTATGQAGGTLCTNTCPYSNDKSCDDGHSTAATKRCALGTDCLDCGSRSVEAPSCSNTCRTANNGRCEDLSVILLEGSCAVGTDCNDCRNVDAGFPFPIFVDAGATVSDAGREGGASDAATPSGVRTPDQAELTADAQRRVLEATDLPGLAKRFAELATLIARQLDGTYLLAYCSPKRTGKHELKVMVNAATDPRSVPMRAPFDATNFKAGCMIDALVASCDSKQCGGFNCGACDDETETCDAATDQCKNACLAQNRCDAKAFTNPLGYEQLCDLGETYTQCGSQCLDVRSDKSNCGACGKTCNATSTCVAGACVCPSATLTSCSDGCLDLKTDRAHCGSCTTSCPATNPRGEAVTCAEGACKCGAGFSLCNNQCVDTSTNSQNCGGCGIQCGSGSSCVAGQCLCTNTALTSCPGGSSPGPRTCVNVLTNTQHCGGCGRSCGEPSSCSAGQCGCTGGSINCGGICSTLISDPKNCGMCGKACAPGESCVSSTCVASGFSMCSSANLSGPLPIKYAGTLGAPKTGGLCSAVAAPQTALQFVAPSTGTYTFVAEPLDFMLEVDIGNCNTVSNHYCATNGIFGVVSVPMTAGQAVRVIAYSTTAAVGTSFSLSVNGSN